jgi:competence protein ComEA
MWFMKFGLLCLPMLLVPVLSAQDMPDGPGKENLDKVCTTCHDLGAVTGMSGGTEIWQSVIDDMKSRGADRTETDFKAIVGYLSKYYGPQVKINTDAAKDIQANLGLTDTEAAAIVKYRTDKGPFKEWADVMKVPGLDTGKLTGLQRRIKY